MKILILGANGHIATLVRQQLPSTTDLRLFVRHPEKLALPATTDIQVGDATDVTALTQAMQNVDLVYANLNTPNIEAQATAVTTAMHNAGVTRLIWIATLGIYDEVPGEFGRYNRDYLRAGGDQSYLATEARAATTIKKSGLTFTIIRPAWLTDGDSINYETTNADEPFKGTIVTRKSVAAFITKIIATPTAYENQSLGVNQPNTDGDRPQL